MDLTGSMGAIVIIVLALGIAATNSMMLYCGVLCTPDARPDLYRRLVADGAGTHYHRYFDHAAGDIPRHLWP